VLSTDRWLARVGISRNPYDGPGVWKARWFSSVGIYFGLMLVFGLVIAGVSARHLTGLEGSLSDQGNAS
jgi:hypothetical protein